MNKKKTIYNIVLQWLAFFSVPIPIAIITQLLLAYSFIIFSVLCIPRNNAFCHRVYPFSKNNTVVPAVLKVLPTIESNFPAKNKVHVYPFIKV